MSIKVLLLDMDGTTLEKNQVTISKRNMEAIGRAIEKGIHVIPCTGRVLDMYPPQLLKMEGIRYCVTGHGARAPGGRKIHLSEFTFTCGLCPTLPDFRREGNLCGDCGSKHDLHRESSR